jgi:hypothetical protein
MNWRNKHFSFAIVEAVVPVTVRRRERRVGLRATADAHRQAVVGTDGEGQISPRQGLIGGLPPRRLVAPTVAGVEDQVAEVPVVLVAARDEIESAPSD